MIKVGIGTRILNYLIDTFIFFWIAFAGHKWFEFRYRFYHDYYLTFAQCFFIAWFLFYIVCEGITARTPGKKFTSSVVVNKNGGKPAFWQILVRSIVRLTIIDFLFIPFFEKPLHDVLSSTEVVETK
ncbi:RDD family protein [Filimonas lacunae]|uniref:RDD family protein n=1 Tax=Filimonas lacunae TaxID=477680 RepID=A0A173MB20_9BACT|nr:RDD family protein [Filimonas lacunae]BAV04681.1 hypothetical protein FLA_0675 [Filimonas lacunae]SIT32396.1 RDD family protein [Filimonas lacunae]